MNTRASAPSLAMCIATNRPEQILTFLNRWIPHLNRARESAALSRIGLFIHEDHPGREFSPPPIPSAETVHTCHADIADTLRADAWIIPVRSGASRSFPMYLAWKAGFDFILTTDDDCLPPEQGPELFFEQHLAAFRLDRWFRTIGGEDPRGIPYGDKGALPVLLNHGLWTGVPDFDGPTALVRSRSPVSVVLRSTREIIPSGMWFPLCAMNVCYTRGALPAAYNLIMGLEQTGLDRFDDIWSGLFLKRIADHLGLYITNGLPFIHHTKASNYFLNLRKEALGIQLHEALWRHVASAPLSGNSVIACYRSLAQWVSRFPKEHPTEPCPKGYFERLGEAMQIWAGLFGEGIDPAAK